MQLYDDIADSYHLIYADWEATSRGQAEVLQHILGRMLGEGPLEIRDVSCGIGTQTLGLAQLGHRLAASDLSARALERAERMARERGLEIRFSRGDMRECAEADRGTFDAVISCDNSVPHLLTDEDILAAMRAFEATLRPGGVALVTVRDYDEEPRDVQFRPFGIREADGARFVVYQIWDWDESGNHYDFAMYFVRDDGRRRPEVLVSRARYYAVGTDRLQELMVEAGFEEVERIDEVYFQPVLVGRKRGVSS